MKRQYRYALTLLLFAGVSLGSSFTHLRSLSYARLRLRLPQLAIDSSTSKEDIPILLETDQVLVVNKPPGVAHHDSENELGILNLLRARMESSSPRIYGVHRLDRVTSGILVLAKSSTVAGSMQRMFREGKVIKYYVGLSSKKPKKKQGLVEGGMVRGRRSSWFLTRAISSNDTTTTATPYAKTRFYTAGLGHLKSSSVCEAKTMLLFRPYTGKTHQLRVASKSVGLPLLGDPIYGSSSKVDDVVSSTNTRTFLHALSLIHI